MIFIFDVNYKQYTKVKRVYKVAQYQQHKQLISIPLILFV